MAPDDTRVAEQIGALTAQVEGVRGDVADIKATLSNGFGLRLRETGTQVAVLDATVASALSALDSAKAHHATLAGDIQEMSSTVAAIKAARKVEIRNTIAWTGVYVGTVAGVAVFVITTVIPKWIMHQ